MTEQSLILDFKSSNWHGKLFLNWFLIQKYVFKCVFWQDLTSAPATCHSRSIYCTSLNFLHNLGQSPQTQTVSASTTSLWYHMIGMPFQTWFSDLDNPNQLSLKIFSTSEIQYYYFHRAVPWSLSPSWPHPAPSSPNTTPLPHLGRCRWSANSGSSGWCSVSGPQPKPGRRQMTWETR